MFLYLLFLVVGFSSGEEHCSKFHYEEKMLEKLIRMEIRMEEMQRKLDKLETNFEGINTSVADQLMKKQERKTIAFFATLLHTRKTFGVDEKLVFENVVTNLGDAYDPTYGTFVAPTSGTYVFFSTVLGSQDVELWNYISVNDNVVARFNSHGTEGRHDSGTATVVVHLNKGDAVSVNNWHQKGNTFGADYTHFGGFGLDC